MTDLEQEFEPSLNLDHDDFHVFPKTSVFDGTNGICGDNNLHRHCSDGKIVIEPGSESIQLPRPKPQKNGDEGDDGQNNGRDNERGPIVGTHDRIFDFVAAEHEEVLGGAMKNIEGLLSIKTSVPRGAHLSTFKVVRRGAVIGWVIYAVTSHLTST